MHRKTVRRALAAAVPPKYSRPLTVSKVDPISDWICEQLAVDPRTLFERQRAKGRGRDEIEVEIRLPRYDALIGAW